LTPIPIQSTCELAENPSLLDGVEMKGVELSAMAALIPGLGPLYAVQVGLQARPTKAKLSW